jgi:hypothetical protein
VSKRDAVELVPALENIPVIIGEGRYRLYRKPDGTMRVQFRQDGTEEDAFFEFPGGLLVIAQKAAEGNMNPVQMMREVAKLMTGFGNGS